MTRDDLTQGIGDTASVVVALSVVAGVTTGLLITAPVWASLLLAIRVEERSWRRQQRENALR